MAAATKRWSSWAKWNENLQLTLADAQRSFAGEQSIDEARRRSKGVPSVLDLHEIADKRRAGVCWVLSSDELHEHFGSKAPTKKAIEAGAESFIARLAPDESVAVIAYLRSMPCAVLFAGA